MTNGGDSTEPPKSGGAGSAGDGAGEAESALQRAEDLLGRLEATRAKLEQTEDPEQAIEVLAELSEIAKQVEAELQRARRQAGAGA